jgi:hypothetical protein
MSKPYRIRTTQVADAVAITEAWNIVPENERSWFDLLLRASSIARTDAVLMRHDYTLTIGLRIKRAGEGTGPEMAWFFEACSALGEQGVKGADRLYRVFDETIFNLPCCPECNGYDGDDVDPETYCKVGRLWSEHPAEQQADLQTPDDADVFADCNYRA